MTLDELEASVNAQPGLAPSTPLGKLKDTAGKVAGKAGELAQGAEAWMMGKALPKAGELGSNIYNADTRFSEGLLAQEFAPPSRRTPLQAGIEAVQHPETWDANRAALEHDLGIDYLKSKALGPHALTDTLYDTALDLGVSPSTYGGGFVGKGLSKAGGAALEGAWRIPEVTLPKFGRVGVERTFRPDFMVRTQNPAELARQGRHAFTPAEVERYEGIVGRKRLEAHRLGLSDEQREENIRAAVEHEGLPYVQQAQRAAKESIGHTLSNMGKEAMFSNPLPHMGNIAERVRLREGEGVLFRAFHLLGKPDPHLVQLTEHYGGTEHFLREPETLIAKGKYNPYGHLLKASNKALDNFETAFRSAVFEKYLKEAQARHKGPPTEADLYHAGAMARKVADYANTSGLTRWLSDKLGAPFPQWHVNIMGQAIGDALAHPERAGRFFDVGHNVNRNIAEPYLGVDLVSGKPTEEALGAVSGPFNYYGGMSTLGLASIVPDAARAAMHHERMDKFLGEEGQKLGAWVVPPVVTQAAGLNPYNAPGDARTRAALGLAGIRTKKIATPPAPTTSAPTTLDEILGH